MKKNLIILIIVVVLIVAGFVIYDKLRYGDQGTVGGTFPSWWVYKTKGDYFDLHLVHLDTDRGKLIQVEHGVKTMYRLDDSYVAHLGAPYFSHLTFVNISVSEFKAAEEAEKDKYWECWELIEPFAKRIIEEKCNKTNFERFNPERYPPGFSGAITIEEGYIESNAFSINYINKEGNGDSCYATLSSEEKDEYEDLRKNVDSCVSAIPRAEIFDNYVDVEYLLNNVVDDDPFTEFYLCDVDFSELNTIINNNELNVKCEKRK
jgi:hypothetical protein